MLCCVSKKAAAGADLEPPMLGLQCGRIVANRASAFAANLGNSSVPRFAKEKAELTLEEDVPSILLPCAICARTFAPQSLEKHIKICERSAIKKRRPFDSAKQRIQGTELEEFLPKQEHKRPHQEERIGKSKTSWKQTHDEFLRAVRAARGEPIEVPSKQTPNHVTSGAPTRANEKGSCPTCNRQFGIKAYDRHVAWCRERCTRVQISPATNLAKERLEARIRYRAPALKNRRPTIREKYMPGCATNLGYAPKSSPPANATRVRESVSLPNCNKGNDCPGPAKQKPAARKVGQSKESSIPTGPIKSRPMDRVRPVEDLQSESARSRISSFSSPPKHPLPSLNPGKFPNFSITSNANYLTKFDTRAITDPISQRKDSGLIKTQKSNIVSARSYGNPKLNDIAVNNDVFGLTIQPCYIHQEHEFVTWKQISEENLEHKENLDSKRNFNSKRQFQLRGYLEPKDNIVSESNLLGLKISQDHEGNKKTGMSKIFDILDTIALTETELLDREVDSDLSTTWISRVRKLDQTYLIKENTEDHLETEVRVSETLKPVLNNPKIIKDTPEETVSETNPEFSVSKSPEPEIISSQNIFVAKTDKACLDDLPSEFDSPTRFDNEISFVSTPISDLSNKEFLEKNSRSSGEANVGFTELLFSKIKAEEKNMTENEFISLKDLDGREWEKEFASREELVKGENGKNEGRNGKKILKNKNESVRILDFSGAECHSHEKEINYGGSEFKKKNENETKSYGEEGNELQKSSKDIDLLLERRNELSYGKGEVLLSESKGELSSQREKYVSSEKLQSQLIKEISSSHSSDSLIQNIENKDSSRQRSDTYIIEKPFIKLSKHNRSPDVCSFDLQLQEPLKKKRRTDEGITNLDCIDKNLEDINSGLNSSSNLKLFDSMNEANITMDESFGEIYKNCVIDKSVHSDFKENKTVEYSNCKLNLEEENFQLQFSNLKLSEENGSSENQDKLEEELNKEIFTIEVNNLDVESSSEILIENSFDESKLSNEIIQVSELAPDQIGNDYEIRVEDSLESIVLRTKNLGISDKESSSDLLENNDFTNCENVTVVKSNMSEDYYLKTFDPLTKKCEKVDNDERSLYDTENNKLEENQSKGSKDGDKKLEVEKSTTVKDDFIKITKERDVSSSKNNSVERKKLHSKNKIEIGTISRSSIPRQISRTDIKLNSRDQFWKKKNREIPNFEANLYTFKNEAQPKLREKSGNFLLRCKEEENEFDSQAFLKLKQNSSRRLLGRKETICLSLPENDLIFSQEVGGEKLIDGRKTENNYIIESNSNVEEKNSYENNKHITIGNPDVAFQSKSLLSLTRNDYDSVKLNSAKLEKKILRSLNLLRGSTDTLISSVEDRETTSKTPSMVDFFIDETCKIEEIRTPHGSTRYKLLPVIGTDSRSLGEKESVKNYSRGDSYWERASRVSKRRLIGSEALKDEEKFTHTNRNPRVRTLPPVACSASGKLSGSNKTYDPYLMAEQQMRELLSDTSDISSTDGISAQPNSTPKENPTQHPLTLSPAFVKYPPQTLPTPIDSSKKRASLIDPPSEFDDLTSDFSSYSTETNSITRELLVNDLISQTRDASINFSNTEKAPSRDHILGRRVKIDKSKALGSDHEGSSREQSLMSSVEKTRKILEKVSCPKLIRPIVNRSHSVRAASAPKIPERKGSSSSESSGSQKKCMKTSKSSDLSLADRSNNNHNNSNNNNSTSSYASTMNGSNLSLNSIVSSDVDMKRSNSMFDDLMSSFDEDSSTILPSLRFLLKNDPLSMSSPIQSSHKRNGQVSDDDLSSPDSYKRQDHSKLSADSAYSSLNRKYYNHGRSTNEMASRLDEDPPQRCREGESRFLSNSKMSKFCHECGSKFPDSAKFCCECGVKRLTL